MVDTQSNIESGKYTSHPELYHGSQTREFLGQPIGLGVLFFTEMWERFSYYGMRALLILYLTKHYLFSAGESSLIYASYTGLAYLLPIVGGALSDHYLGPRKAVTFGAILLVMGHLSLAWEGPPPIVNGEVIARSEFHLNIFFLSLALIITGVGFLKANISTIVGNLYGEKDPRRDGGFTIFYMGINLGSFLATLIVGGVGEIYGWGYGFGLAGIGMCFGLAVFLWGQRFLDGRADPPNPELLKRKIFAFLDREKIIYLMGFGFVAAMWLLIQHQKLVGTMLGASGFIMIAIILAYGFISCTKIERERLMVACFLIVMQTIFWALFEQQGSSLTLLADQQFNLTTFGITWQASQVQTLNPFFIVLFGIPFSLLWAKLGTRGLEPSTPAKFAISMLLIGFGYLVFSWGLNITEGTSRSFFWLFIIYLFMTWAELCLSPVGLSMVTRLSVSKIVGMTMGTWFLFTSLANYVAGWLSSLTGSEEASVTDAGLLDVAATAELYQLIGFIAFGAGIFIFVLTPLLKKGIHGAH